MRPDPSITHDIKWNGVWDLDCLWVIQPQAWFPGRTEPLALFPIPPASLLPSGVWAAYLPLHLLPPAGPGLCSSEGWSVSFASSCSVLESRVPCILVGEILDLLEPQFPHLQNTIVLPLRGLWFRPSVCTRHFPTESEDLSWFGQSWVRSSLTTWWALFQGSAT